MDSGFEIRKYFLDKGERKWAYVLAVPGRKSFMDKCVEKDPHRARRIATTAERIFDRGVGWGLVSKTIKQLKGVKGSVSVFETRVNGGVVRVAVYLHCGNIPVYLFDFDTHSGSGNNIPAHFLDRAAMTARKAAVCADEYDFSEYEEHRK